MSGQTFSDAGCKYESPSCEIYDVAAETLLAGSFGGSTIDSYAEDPTVTDL